MDIYGIGDSILGFVTGYLRGSQKIGRDELILERLKKGDCVVCGTQDEKREFSRLITARGIDGVDVFVCHPVKLDGLVGRGRQWDSVYFSYFFIEQFYESRINEMFEELDRISLRLIRQSARPTPPKPPKFRIS